METVFLLYEQISTRELSAILWSSIVIIWLLSQKNIRESFVQLFVSVFQIKIIWSITAAILYTSILVFILEKLGVWSIFVLKDTIYWFIGIGLVLLVNSNSVNEEDWYFKKILKNNFKMILVLEFILNFYTFSLYIELLLFPVMTFLVLMYEFSNTEGKYVLVQKIFGFILSLIGIILIIITLENLFNNFNGFIAYSTFTKFILPIVLTIWFMPFMYFLALIMSYEVLFMRLNFFIKGDNYLLTSSKWEIIRFCHINLFKLNEFKRVNNKALIYLQKKEDIVKLMQNYPLEK